MKCEKKPNNKLVVLLILNVYEVITAIGMTWIWRPIFEANIKGIPSYTRYKISVIIAGPGYKVE